MTRDVRLRVRYGSPAVLPGENTAPLVSRCVHGVDDADGNYVFTFTIHGKAAPTDEAAGPGHSPAS
jgi:hypothetical protein